MSPLLFLIFIYWVFYLFLGFPGSGAGKESTYDAGDLGSTPGSGRYCGEVIGYPLQYSWASQVAQSVKKSSCNAGDLGLIPGLGRSPGGGHGNPLQYSSLENPHGQRSWVGYSSWGYKESDTTELLGTAQLSIWFVSALIFVISLTSGLVFPSFLVSLGAELGCLFRCFS